MDVHQPFLPLAATCRAALRLCRRLRNVALSGIMLAALAPLVAIALGLLVAVHYALPHLCFGRRAARTQLAGAYHELLAAHEDGIWPDGHRSRP